MSEKQLNEKYGPTLRRLAELSKRSRLAFVIAEQHRCCALVELVEEQTGGKLSMGMGLNPVEAADAAISRAAAAAIKAAAGKRSA